MKEDEGEEEYEDYEGGNEILPPQRQHVIHAVLEFMIKSMFKSSLSLVSNLIKID